MLKRPFLPDGELSLKEPLGVILRPPIGTAAATTATCPDTDEANSTILSHFFLDGNTSANAATAAAAFADFQRPKMIVFDKDGTLGNDSESLQRWVLHMTGKVEQLFTNEETSQQDRDQLLADFFEFVGFDAKRNKVIPSGPVAAGTWDGCRKLVSDFLLLHAMLDTKALVQRWHDELGDVHGTDAPLVDDLPGLMRTCHQMGYKVGLCTSDDREPTEKALKAWKIDDLVDVSICGDEVVKCKPSAAPLVDLCGLANEQEGNQCVGYLPQGCVVVGDTTADTGMARASRAGFCVGVLTGSGTAEQLLETGAHLILPNVADLPKLLQLLERLSHDEHSHNEH